MCNALHRIGFGLIYFVSFIKDLLHIGSLISYYINYLRMIHIRLANYTPRDQIMKFTFMNSTMIDFYE